MTAIPEVREAPVSVRMNASLKRRIDRAAKRNKISRNLFITNALIVAIEADERKVRAGTRQVSTRLKTGAKR